MDEPCKGTDQEWVVAHPPRDGDRLGHHGDLVLPTTGELTLLDLVRDLEKGRGQDADDR